MFGKMTLSPSRGLGVRPMKPVLQDGHTRTNANPTPHFDTGSSIFANMDCGSDDFVA